MTRQPVRLRLIKNVQHNLVVRRNPFCRCRLGADQSIFGATRRRPMRAPIARLDSRVVARPFILRKNLTSTAGARHTVSCQSSPAPKPHLALRLGVALLPCRAPRIRLKILPSRPQLLLVRPQALSSSRRDRRLDRSSLTLVCKPHHFTRLTAHCYCKNGDIRCSRALVASI